MQLPQFVGDRAPRISHHSWDKPASYVPQENLVRTAVLGETAFFQGLLRSVAITKASNAETELWNCKGLSGIS